jgi:phenylpyruvate tautomerase PptA (4-oxalocrotonate tautomerase family)
MPLITIDVIKGRSEAELRTLLDTVHAAMVEAFGVPNSDRYQILTEHEPHQLVARDTGLGLTRTEDLVICGSSAVHGRKRPSSGSTSSSPPDWSRRAVCRRMT